MLDYIKGQEERESQLEETAKEILTENNPYAGVERVHQEGDYMVVDHYTDYFDRSKGRENAYIHMDAINNKLKTNEKN